MSQFHQKMIDRLMALRPEIKGLVSMGQRVLINDADWDYVVGVANGTVTGNESRTHELLGSAEYLAKWGCYPHE